MPFSKTHQRIVYQHRPRRLDGNTACAAGQSVAGLVDADKNAAQKDHAALDDTGTLPSPARQQQAMDQGAALPVATAADTAQAGVGVPDAGAQLADSAADLRAGVQTTASQRAGGKVGTLADVAGAEQGTPSNNVAAGALTKSGLAKMPLTESTQRQVTDSQPAAASAAAQALQKLEKSQLRSYVIRTTKRSAQSVEQLDVTHRAM